MFGSPMAVGQYTDRLGRQEGMGGWHSPSRTPCVLRV